MYKTGADFKYDLLGTYNDSHKCKLHGLEYKAKDLMMEMNNFKNNVNCTKIQTDNMKRDLDDTYNKLKKDMNDEVDDFEMNFNKRFNQQKEKNAEMNKEINNLKNELLNTKNLLTELQRRMQHLQFKVNGKTIY